MVSVCLYCASFPLFLQGFNELLDCNCDEVEHKLKPIHDKCQEMSTWLETHPNGQELEYESRIEDVARIENLFQILCRNHYKTNLEEKLSIAIAEVSFFCISST